MSEQWSEFLFAENDWLQHKYEYLELVRSERYYTFKAALNLLLQRTPSARLIVETGTMRVHNDVAGCSTLLFGAFCKFYDARLITIDINPLNLKFSMEETKEFSDHIRYVHADSVTFLRNFKEHIDLLYLDSLDCPPEGDASEAQRHQLNEFLAAEDKLSKGSMYMGDDSRFANGGKTRLLKKYLLSKPQWKCILDMSQTLWQMVE